MLASYRRTPKKFQRIKAKSLFANYRFEYEVRRNPEFTMQPKIFKVEDCLKCNNAKKYYTFYDKYLYKRVSIDNFVFLFMFLLNAFFFFDTDVLIEKFFHWVQ
jgi:hypothetical protein